MAATKSILLHKSGARSGVEGGGGGCLALWVTLQSGRSPREAVIRVFFYCYEERWPFFDALQSVILGRDLCPLRAHQNKTKKYPRYNEHIQSKQLWSPLLGHTSHKRFPSWGIVYTRDSSMTVEHHELVQKTGTGPCCFADKPHRDTITHTGIVSNRDI